MKKLVRRLGEDCTLWRDDRTGIAWVHDPCSGDHSCHPNIDDTGSVRGIKANGYWRAADRCVRAHGFIFNIDRLLITDKLDAIAADNCLCPACAERRAREERKH